MAASQGYNYGVIQNGPEYNNSYGVPQSGSRPKSSGYVYDEGERHRHATASQSHDYGIHQSGAGIGAYRDPSQESKTPLAIPTEIMTPGAAIYQDINWPDGPRFLRRSVVFKTFNGILDTLLILAAVAFLCLAAIAIRLEDTPTHEAIGPSFEEAIKLGPTIYPILFAAIAGRALKSIGRFRVEQGARITTLWPLLNSRTMFDAVFSQWQLAQFSIVASILVILWSLSPLGGQAALRLVYRTNLTSTEIHDVRYLDTGPLGNMYAFQAVVASNDLEKDAQGLPLTMGSLYEASLMQDSPTKRGPVDNWGNMKIPRVDRLDPSLADADGWIDVDNNTSVETYYSLLGLPIVSLPGTDGVTEFTVESVYVALAAASHQSFGPPRINNETSLGFTGMSMTCPDCISRLQNQRGDNLTIESARQRTFWGSPFTPFNASQLANKTISGPRYIRFDSGTFGDGQTGISGTSTVWCDVTQHFVEAAIRCEFGNCRATRVRKSTTDNRNPNTTTFDYWGTYALDMVSVRSRADGSSVSSPSELFINDSSSSPIKTAFQQPSLSTLNFSRADPQEFADRATMLLNTALQIFMAPSGFTGGLPTDNLTIYGAPHIPADGAIKAASTFNTTVWRLEPEDLVGGIIMALAPFAAANTTATVTLFEEVYKADRAWVGVLILSSTVLILMGLTGLYLGGQTRAPDVFDPLMALTYNNPHFNSSTEASTLDASERARLLSDVAVRLGDVQPYAEVGKISLGQTAAVQGLQRGRMYA